jgi:hypothetical protein
VPRLDYYTSGGTAGCPALLVEPSGSNLCLQSENFATTWGQTVLNLTSGFISPTNSNLGTLIEATANTGRLRQTFAAGLTSGVTSTFSLFAKLGTQSSGVTLVFQEGTGTNYASGACQSFRLDTGAVGTSGTVGAGFTITRSNIENYGNGWYRCSLTIQLSYTPSSANLTIRPTSTVTANLPVIASGDTCYIFGAQLETGSVATSYIPTTTAAVTRNADVITLSGAVSGCIGQTEGTIYAEVDFRNTSSGKRLFLLSDGTSQNEIRVTSSATNAGDLQFAVRLAGTLIVNSFSPTNVYSNGIFKIAAVYKSTDYALYVNGLQVLTGNAAGNIPACNRVDIGSQLGTSNFLNDRIRAAALYTTRLTNAELQALTTL